MWIEKIKGIEYEVDLDYDDDKEVSKRYIRRITSEDTMSCPKDCWCHECYNKHSVKEIKQAEAEWEASDKGKSCRQTDECICPPCLDAYLNQVPTKRRNVKTKE